MTIQQQINNFLPQLTKCSDTPYQDLTLLLADTLSVTPTYLRSHGETTLTSAQQSNLQIKINRRLQGEPVAYILEQQGFWNLTLRVTPDVLIPRPETELLVELALNFFDAKSPIKVADLGTGSGAIVLALATERPTWQFVATDYSDKALVIAKQNAKTLQQSRIQFFQGSWCEALSPQQKYNLIISNPPYIANHDPHLDNLKFEPSLALVASQNGLAAFEQIIFQSKNYLSANGMLLLEHGYQQAGAVAMLLQKNGFDQIRTEVDLNGHSRATYGWYRGS